MGAGGDKADAPPRCAFNQMRPRRDHPAIRAGKANQLLAIRIPRDGQLQGAVAHEALAPL